MINMLKPFDSKDYADFAEKSLNGLYQKDKVVGRYNVEFVYEPVYGGILRGKYAMLHAFYARQMLSGFDFIFTSFLPWMNYGIDTKVDESRKTGRKVIIIDTHCVTNSSNEWKHFFRFDTDKMEELRKYDKNEKETPTQCSL